MDEPTETMTVHTGSEPLLYVPLLHCPSFNRDLDCSNFLAIVTRASINTDSHIPVK